MTEAPGELWLPHERTYTREPPTADPDEQAFIDLHGEPPAPRAHRPVATIDLKGTLL